MAQQVTFNPARHAWYQTVTLNGRTFEGTRCAAETWSRLAPLVDWRGRRILDLACAEGYYACRAIQAGAVHAEGVEWRADRVEAARWLADQLGVADRVRFSKGDVDTASGRYDVVLCLCLAHWYPDPFRILQHAARLTAPGGCCIFETWVSRKTVLPAVVIDPHGRGDGRQQCLLTRAGVEVLTTSRLVTGTQSVPGEHAPRANQPLFETCEFVGHGVDRDRYEVFVLTRGVT